MDEQRLIEEMVKHSPCRRPVSDTTRFVHHESLCRSTVVAEAPTFNRIKDTPSQGDAVVRTVRAFRVCATCCRSQYVMHAPERAPAAGARSPIPISGPAVVVAMENGWQPIQAYLHRYVSVNTIGSLPYVWVVFDAAPVWQGTAQQLQPERAMLVPTWLDAMLDLGNVAKRRENATLQTWSRVGWPGVLAWAAANAEFRDRLEAVRLLGGEAAQLQWLKGQDWEGIHACLLRRKRQAS